MAAHQSRQSFENQRSQAPSRIPLAAGSGIGQAGPMRHGDSNSKAESATTAQVVLVDNHDSFSKNMQHALVAAGAQCQLVRDGELTAAELLRRPWDGIVIGAGPCSPDDTRTSLDLVRALLNGPDSRPLLGICLGHQCLAAAAGLPIERARQAMHGRSCAVRHDGKKIFAGLPQPMIVARYNSLSVAATHLQPPLLATAWDEEGQLMGLRHQQLPLQTVQFHPESHLSVGGQHLFDNWVKSLADRSDSQ